MCKIIVFNPVLRQLRKIRKIPKMSPGAYIFQRPFLRGLFLEGHIFGRAYLRGGNLRFKIDWAGLIVGSEFNVFALFYSVCKGNFPSTSPRGRLYLDVRFNGGFFALPFWGAYIWRGLYMERLIFGILR